ncbi:hypothetical protein F5B21DRAFT_528592 [Xylaria acuta]|nr:hypothetical protein F5B21DRAFT_528592 [Xylaria acuta]
MDSFSCPQSFNISSQQDIDASTTGLAQCGNSDVFINIISPTTDLVFPPGLFVNSVSVTNLQDSLNLNLNATDIVGDLFIENFNNGSLVLPIQVEPRNGTIRSVALTTSDLSQRADDQVHVYGNGTSAWNQVNGTITTLHDITYLSVMQLQGTHLISSTLKSVTNLEVDGGLLDTDQLSFINNNATFTNFVFPFWSSQSLQVGGDLTVQHKVNFDSDVDPEGSSLDFDWDVQFVYGNFAVQDWSNATLRLPTLTEVRKQLSIHDSNNSTFIIPALTSVGTLIMENNGESILPGDFRNLQFADSIQLRGKIDTTSFGNLFPSLKHVKQSITIEASNSDFNCSYLASQQSQGLIGQLICNGLDGDDSDTSPPSAATKSGVSRSVWIGISIAVAIAVLSNS